MRFEKYEDGIKVREILKEKDMKLVDVILVSIIIFVRIFQDEIHGKDGEQRELQKVLSEIRREHDNLKREVK